MLIYRSVHVISAMTVEWICDGLLVIYRQYFFRFYGIYGYLFHESWLTCVLFRKNTIPETNISPENRPLEKEIPIGNHHF